MNINYSGERRKEDLIDFISKADALVFKLSLNYNLLCIDCFI